MILGDKQIDTFEAMLALTGFSRRPHELVADIVLAAIQRGQADPEVQNMAKLLRAARRSRLGIDLHVVRDQESG
jgi:hypothetical protein